MDRHQRLDLGREAIGPRGGMFAPRRRRRHLPIVLLVGALATVPAVATVLARNTVPAGAAEPGGGPVDSGVVAATGEGGAEQAPERDSTDVPASRTAVFATYEGLPLHLPSTDTLLVGFHEASQREALGLTPNGRLLENANTTRISPPADVDDGADYVILSSRGRTPAPTSAVDLVMRDDDPVRSPVSGVVTDVRAYHLYGQHPDHRIEILPEGRPDLRVVLIHVADVQVRAGDGVEAGETVLAATANRFPFGSHIDRYTEPDRWPHVHVEVKRAGAG